MTPAVLVICLLLTVTTASAGPPAGEGTGTSLAARIPRVREVRFTGNPVFDPDALERVLRALESRRVIPGLWTRRPLYEARVVEADLARLRSFYLSHGYFDARVGLGGVTVDGRDAIVTLEVQAGPKYVVRRVEFDGLDGEHGDSITHSTGEFPFDALCTPLLDARGIAESHGRIDFDVELEVSHTDGPALPGTGQDWADVTAHVRMGPAFTVGRINFTGHQRFNESTLRRAMALQERSLFDAGKLRASLARLNRTGLLEPLTLRDVEIQRNPDTLTADLTIAIREQRPRRWSLSGPIGPSALGLLEATISSRLPPWGRGILEASTYYLTFSLTGFSNPLIRLLPIRVSPSPPALLVLERPYLPGQSVLSGFALSPQLSARQMLTGYALTHLDRAVQAVIAESPDSSLVVPLSGPQRSGGSEEARFLICNPPAPRYRWLRRGAAIAANLALGAFRPY